MGFGISGPSRPISARLVSCDLIEVFTISSRVAMPPNPACTKQSGGNSGGKADRNERVRLMWKFRMLTRRSWVTKDTGKQL
jgi:hypothetical protein